jgi:Carboxypeptidase regulatory-like domain
MRLGLVMAVRTAVAALCLCALGAAQEPINTLEGQITDASYAVVSGAQVMPRNPQTGLTRTVLSSRQATFQISNLPAGEYDIDVHPQGFAVFSAKAIRVNIGQVAIYDIQLEVASAHSEVSVTGRTVMVDTSQTIGDSVSTREAQDLPLNGRDLTQLGLRGGEKIRNRIQLPYGQPVDLSRATQAGQFGNAGRNIVRAPGIENVDLAMFKAFSLGKAHGLQFRAECFNLLNHANLRLPENDLQSPAFGQILQAGSPRLLQLAVKVVF